VDSGPVLFAQVSRRAKLVKSDAGKFFGPRSKRQVVADHPWFRVALRGCLSCTTTPTSLQQRQGGDLTCDATQFSRPV
jgi:hypothetical protein